MKLPAIVQTLTVLCLLLASSAASATVVTLSASSAAERQSLSSNPANPQSACPSASGCQPQAGPPAASPASPAAGHGTEPAPNDVRYFTSSLATDRTDASLSPADSPPAAASYVPAHVIDAADQFTSDEELKWKVKLKMLQAYSGVRALASLLEPDQDTTQGAGTIGAAQLHDITTGAPGAGYAGGAIDQGMNSVCVARDGSYNTIGAANQKSCPEGSIFVSTNRNAGMEEYVAYSQSLNNTAKGAATPFSLHMADLRSPHNAPAARQFKRCNECEFEPGGILDPGLMLRMLKWIKEPGSMLMLLAAAVFVGLISGALARARNT